MGRSKTQLDYEKVNNWKTEIDTTDGTVFYVGKAPLETATSDNKWQIKKIELTGTVYEILWADGDDLFNNVWDNHATTVVYS